MWNNAQLQWRDSQMQYCTILIKKKKQPLKLALFTNTKYCTFSVSGQPYTGQQRETMSQLWHICYLKEQIPALPTTTGKNLLRCPQRKMSSSCLEVSEMKLKILTMQYKDGAARRDEGCHIYAGRKSYSQPGLIQFPMLYAWAVWRA